MVALVFWIALVVIVLAYMSLWYGLARYTGRLDVVDSAWGLGFVLVGWISLGLRAHYGSLQVVSTLLVSVWGLRLFAHIGNRNWRKSEDDHRYQELRQKWGAPWKRKAYTNVFLLQGALLLVVSLPMTAIAWADNVGLNTGIWVGWAIWLLGICFEALADDQLRRFIKQRPKGSHNIMDRGLWRYSRHPNYFGEVTTWWGAAIVAISAGEWWGLFGAVVITILVTKVSGIPPLEKHYEGNTDYERYRARTSVLVPWSPKRSNP